MPTIKDAFTLRVAKIDSALAPLDSQRFTFAMFQLRDTLNISGTSAESAAMSGTPHSRDLLQWRLVPWYNMHHQHPRHLADCHDAKHLCIQGFLGYCGFFGLVAR